MDIPREYHVNLHCLLSNPMPIYKRFLESENHNRYLFRYLAQLHFHLYTLSTIAGLLHTTYRSFVVLPGLSTRYIRLRNVYIAY
jgi:hypothetical protein